MRFKYPSSQPERLNNNQKLIGDVTAGIEFLWNKLKIRNIAGIVRPENICYIKDKETFFLSNWFQLCQPEADHVKSDRLHPSQDDRVLTSQDIVNEIKAIAKIFLRLNGINYEKSIPMGSDWMYSLAGEFALKIQLAELLVDVRPVQVRELFQDLIERMLSLDLQKFPTLEEFKDLKNKVPANIIGKYYGEFLWLVE